MTKLLDLLEKKIGRYAVPNITVYLIAGQTFFYLLFLTGKAERDVTLLSAALLMAGEWWRLATMIFDPPRMSPLFVLFAWYLFYVMGSAIEEYWGAFRYNAFLLAGFLCTVAVAFLIPAAAVSNTFIAGSVFLAFAFLFPDFILQLFFVLPVRIKWLALITWLGYGYLLIFGSWANRLMILAAIGNFLLFFAGDLFWMLKSGRRRLAYRGGSAARRADEPFHRCTVCGITDKSHPNMDFRYCPSCTGQRGYCQEHIFNHEHLRQE
jgi:hypothetical protein